MKQNEIFIKIGKFFSERLEKLESFLILFLLIGLSIRIFTNLNFDIIITLTISFLTIIYFFIGYYTPSHENVTGFAAIVYKLIPWSCSVGVVGFLYHINNWVGYELMINISLVSILISLIFILIFRLRNITADIFKFNWIIRLLLIFILVLSMKYLSNDKLIEIGIIKKFENSQTN